MNIIRGVLTYYLEWSLGDEVNKIFKKSQKSISSDIPWDLDSDNPSNAVLFLQQVQFLIQSRIDMLNLPITKLKR